MGGLDIGVDVVIIAFASAKDLTQSAVDSQIITAFERIQSRVNRTVKV
jgi:hypothetical protein